jgi:hypothetical protein
MFVLANDNVSSGLRRPLAVDFECPTFKMYGKPFITCQMLNTESCCVLNTNWKPRLMYRVATSLKVRDTSILAANFAFPPYTSKRETINTFSTTRDKEPICIGLLIGNRGHFIDW